METSQPQINNKVNKPIIGLAIALAGIIVIGIFLLFRISPAEQGGFVWYLFSFATGLTMIVLPCTLPLAFVIVPLSMGKGVRKGLGIALSFGAGIAITLSLYGVIAAVAGKLTIGEIGAPLEAVKNWFYFVAGIFVYLFALGEVGLIKFRMPSYSGAAPAFIQKQGDFLKALLLGLFLGNIGVGCPHPATPMLLGEIATSQNIFYGWTLFLTHAIGRVLPLLLLAILGIAGINGLSWLISRKDKIERATGWAMVFVAGFILVLGLFTHDWWVNSGIHTQLEKVTQEETILNIIGTKFGTGNVHRHGPEEGPGLLGLPLALGNWVLVLLWLSPIWWWWWRERKRVAAIPAENTIAERAAVSRILTSKKWAFVSVSVLLALMFIYVLPHNFLKHGAVSDEHDSMSMMEEGMPHDAGETTMGGGHNDHRGTLHEESDITNGLVVNLRVEPQKPKVNEKTTFEFLANEKPAGTIVDDLQIEHTKLIHVIGVREDLENFLHVHPSKAGPGKFILTGAFLEPGYYKLWTDVTRAGETHSFGYPLITVTDGKGIEPQRLFVTPTFGTTMVIADYSVQFIHEAPVVKNQALHLGFNIKDQSGRIAQTENYLGASMHLTAIKDDLTDYIHTHPADHAHGASGGSEAYLAFAAGVIAGAGHDPAGAPAPAGKTASTFSAQIPFEITFPKAGIYKLFAQFRPRGIELPPEEPLVAEFFLEVQERPPQVFRTAGEGAVGAIPNPKVVLVIVSLVLMAGLWLAVSRFLKV